MIQIQQRSLFFVNPKLKIHTILNNTQGYLECIVLDTIAIGLKSLVWGSFKNS